MFRNPPAEFKQFLIERVHFYHLAADNDNFSGEQWSNAQQRIERRTQHVGDEHPHERIDGITANLNDA